jgi:UDP-2,4-diacetamido-2,4,6-trideoxy-beta-L-altropyranose hydrolase
MKVVFRTDASLEIGTGHVMRCLTLAEALRRRGAQCHFICRTHPGNLNKQIGERGFDVVDLPFEGNWTGTAVTNPVHAAWLGADWKTDAEQTKVGAGGTAIDWLIVDHYAIDAHWEGALAANYRKLMVIDDLADRSHICDLLLDQTYGREEADYRERIPYASRLLCGSQFALLRPEFNALRPFSLQRRSRQALRELLITMGGVDKANATVQVLQALRTCPLPADLRIRVVMGATAPWLDEVRKQAQDMPWPIQVLTGVSDMAQLMADSDLAIGAAGGTSWERCCLGLPTIMLALADNQLKVAQGLERSGAVKLIDLTQGVTLQLKELVISLVEDPAQLLQMSECGATIVSGVGTDTVVQQMEVCGE